MKILSLINDIEQYQKIGIISLKKGSKINLKSKKHTKICKILNYTKHLLVLASTFTGCVSISVLASLVGIPVDIANSSITINISVITVGLKKYKSIVQKKKK